MKTRIKQIGLGLALLAIAAFSAHNFHGHAPSSSQNHVCGMCESTTDGAGLKIVVTPFSLFVDTVIQDSKNIPTQTVFSSSSSPRGPPLV